MDAYPARAGWLSGGLFALAHCFWWLPGGLKREVGCAIELMLSLGLCEDAPGVLWVCYLERV